MTTAADLLAQYGTRIVGIALLAAVVAGAAALVYRAFSRDRLDRGVSLLVGLAAAALYLNVRSALGEVVLGETAVLSTGAVVFNTASLAAAAAATPIGHGVGDRIATDLVTVGGAETVEAEVSRFARRLGRVTTVTVPEDVGDIEGYDPVPETTKEALAGTTLVFPGRLDVPTLRERLAIRLKDEHEVGYVDAEFDGAGDLAALAVGARQAGLGPTLAPGAAAVAVSADPPYAASAGDVVQVFRGDPPERVATAEVRATVGDVVTLACEAEAASDIAGADVRLVTLPAAVRPEREYAALLRTADETMGAVAVAAGSDLVGTPVGAVDAMVAAVRDAAGGLDAIPSRDRPVAAGDTLYVVARPEAIRSLEERAG